MLRYITNRILIAFLIAISFDLKLQAQTNLNYLYERYTIKEGLSQNAIQRLYQDNIGYIWASSQSGIDRLDGFTIFSYNPKSIKDSTSVRLFMNAIAEDLNGNVWVGGRNGVLSKNNRFLSNWENYSLLSVATQGKKLFKSAREQGLKFEITGIDFSSKPGYAFISTRGMGLILLDLNTKVQVSYWYGDTSLSNRTSNEIHAIKTLPNGLLLLSTSNGLLFFNTKILAFERSLYLSEVPSGFIKFGKAVLTKFQNEIYVASNRGLFKILPYTYTGVQFTSSSKSKLPGNEVSTLAYDSSSNRLWLCINGKGLYYNDLVKFDFNPFDGNKELISMSENSIINDILIDNQNDIWLTPNGSGLIKIIPQNRYFTLYAKFGAPDYFINSISARGVFIDKNDNLWIGAYDRGAGVIEVNRKTKIISNYFFQPGSNLQRTWSFGQDMQGSLWFYNRLSASDASNKAEVVFYKKKMGSNRPDRIISINELKSREIFKSLELTSNSFLFLTKAGDLLIMSNPIIRLSDRNGNIKLDRYNGLDAFKKIDSTTIYSIIRESNGIAYIITPKSVYRWNEQNGTFTNLIPSVEIKELQDWRNHYFSVLGDSLLFIPTYGYGLIKIDLRKGEKKYITNSEHELPSNFLYGTYFDQKKYLWMSSNKGIIRLNIADNTSFSFTLTQGLQGYEFNSQSQFISERGEIAYAGLRGVNSFFPFDLKYDEMPKPIIQRLMFSDYTDKRKILIHSSNYDKTIKIPYDSNKFSIDFISINFNPDDYILYDYRLDGYDAPNKWYKPRGSNQNKFQPSATYENLPSGDYVFRVRSYRYGENKVKKEAFIKLRIGVAPWRSWWAILLYFVLALAVIYFLVNAYERRKIATLENKRKNDDLQEARILQQNMLPRDIPKRSDLDISVILKTSTEVGGDYYDFFEQKDGSLFVVCGDATGHGTASGMMVSVTKAGLSGISATSPNNILFKLNNIIKRVGIKKLKMSLHVLQITSDRFFVSTSAMPPIYFYSRIEKRVEELGISSLPLGSFINEEFEQEERSFQTGDILILISDGIPEARSKDGEILGYKRLYDFINENIHLDIHMLKDALMQFVESWTMTTRYEDDVILLIIKKK